MPDWGGWPRNQTQWSRMVRPHRRVRCAVVVVTVVTMSLLLSGSSPAQTGLAGPVRSVVHFRSLYPQELALGADGSVWVSDEFGGIARLRPSGRVTSYRLGGDQFIGVATDVTLGPDGALWFAALDQVGRIDTRGRGAVGTWRVRGGASARAITAGGGALW